MADGGGAIPADSELTGIGAGFNFRQSIISTEATSFFATRDCDAKLKLAFGDSLAVDQGQIFGCLPNSSFRSARSLVRMTEGTDRGVAPALGTAVRSARTSRLVLNAIGPRAEAGNPIRGET